VRLVRQRRLHLRDFRLCHPQLQLVR
jgi:hypothetical protein